MNNTITYGMVEEKFTAGENIRVSYGIVAYSDFERDGTATIVASAKDLSNDKQRIKDLVKTCNRLQLSLLHFDEVVSDFLAE